MGRLTLTFDFEFGDHDGFLPYTTIR